MALIQATNITKNYRVGDLDVAALKGISFEIDEGALPPSSARRAAGNRPCSI